MDHHSDCISSIQLIWSSHKNCWRAWTSSWDKSICTFVISQIHNLGQRDSELPLPILPTQHNVETPTQIVPSETSSNTNVTREVSVSEDKVEQLLIKREELGQRRKMLDDRKQELDEKKRDLSKRKQELALQMDTLSKGISPNGNE